MVSTQAPPHAVSAPAHIAVQTPALQTCPAAHALPQAPQFVASVVTLTHAPPQAVWPTGHVHAPALHELPPPHREPQAPQFSGSDCSCTQAPPHAV
jgi:hypothetical protein